MAKYPITPVPKPRMTRRDKWAKRPCVLRYYWFKDLVRSYKVELPTENAHVTFWMPMPRSWSKKKKAEMVGGPHQQTPDLDNMLKALADAVYGDDSIIWDIRVTKRWATTGAIQIETKAK